MTCSAFSGYPFLISHDAQKCRKACIEYFGFPSGPTIPTLRCSFPSCAQILLWACVLPNWLGKTNHKRLFEEMGIALRTRETELVQTPSCLATLARLIPGLASRSLAISKTLCSGVQNPISLSRRGQISRHSRSVLTTIGDIGISRSPAAVLGRPIVPHLSAP